MIYEPDGAVFTTEDLDPDCVVGNSPTTYDAVMAKATSWYTNDELAPWRRNRLAMLRDRLPAEMTGVVIDYGCFFGDCTQMLMAHWPDAKVVGMDISSESLEVAAEVNNVYGVLTRPGYVDKPTGWAVQAIVIADVAEHLREPEWMSFLADAWLAVEPGGQFFCHCPIADGLVGRDTAEVLDYHMAQHHHPSIKSVGYIAETLTRTGWAVEVSEPCFENGMYGFASARRLE